ncbi:hypothetical protein FJ414_17560 [Mesorhizobium sp. B3-1-6]|uniref:plasmid partitioning protein RepB C-terminal domain-containing protein n=1 Tax=unclassified Mesorhizobium TaxID=325217 RepID=UPI00112E4A49|nr:MULTISPECIES: plasmid partitioning protein RepB C-terminal domain-containing protein [unclassified Mesorhizobium]TPI35858.1 hypothetical protein FJ414_17560 [Mesorhizobium sp. B3-1-6]TPI51913.1 hypothetical protein FJ417_27735 [Mesorhizobium sp. B3-1-7]
MTVRRIALSLEAADHILQNSRTRHAALLEKMYEPSRLFTGPWLCRTYKAECERTLKMTAEAKTPQHRLETIAGALRDPLKQEQFRRLLSAEGLAFVPKALAERVSAQQPAQSPCPSLEPKPLINGISPEVLDLLQDWYVPPQVFASLRKMVPERQLKAAKLMIALRRANFHYAQLLSTLTPVSQLADPSRPRKKFAGVTADQLAAMEAEFGPLNEEFLYCASFRGVWGLELMAARSYLDRLMENARAVRYLAQNFPEQLATFQAILDIPMNGEALTRYAKKRGSKRKHLVF